MSKKPEPLPIWKHLERVQRELEDFALALNRDGLPRDARRCQEVITALDDLRAQATWPDLATWPPAVTIEGGETHWRTT